MKRSLACSMNEYHNQWKTGSTGKALGYWDWDIYVTKKTQPGFKSSLECSEPIRYKLLSSCFYGYWIPVFCTEFFPSQRATSYKCTRNICLLRNTKKPINVHKNRYKIMHFFRQLVDTEIIVKHSPFSNCCIEKFMHIVTYSTTLYLHSQARGALIYKI
jgi:hypothetical protein